ncbi:MAG: PqiC family protein [Gammaproteobacteria bacterium]|jgi:uncharacterized lipoprotein YmbA
MDKQKSINSNYIFTIVIITLLLSACSGGSSSIRYYLIDPMANATSISDTNEALTIEIMNLHIPQYLERFNIVTRGSENQLFFSEFHQWGDNFRKNLLRTMAQNLSKSLGTNDIGTPINRTLSAADYRVQVHIEQFERNYDGYVKLVARWQVSAANSSEQIVTHKVELISPNINTIDEYENIVYAMKELFGQLSKRVAESIIQQKEDAL